VGGKRPRSQEDSHLCEKKMRVNESWGVKMRSAPKDFVSKRCLKNKSRGKGEVSASNFGNKILR